MGRLSKSIYPKIIFISLLFGMLFWLIEGYYEFIYFHKDLSFMLLEGPETLIEALFTRVPMHSMFVRVSFILASLFGGILISIFFYRRQLAQYELQKNESRFRAYFENSPAAIYETDAKGRFILTNKKWSQISGLSLEQAKGDGWQEALHPDDKACIFNKWKQNAKNGKPWSLEYRFYNPSTQTETWMASTAAAILDEYGEITGYLGVNIDITERKRAKIEAQKAEYERALNEDRLKSLLMLHKKKSLKEKDLLDYALEEAVRLTESECGYLYFVDDDQKHISLNTWSKETLKICTAEKAPHYLLKSAGIWADCVRTKKPVIHPEIVQRI